MIALMELIRVAGATLNQTPLDFDGNARRIKAMLAAAREAGVELLVLPELCITGYGCEDAFFGLATAAAAERVLAELLPETRGITVVIGLPHYHHGAMYNCGAVVQDGRLLGLNAKRVLPREGVHYEARWFKPWPFGTVVQTRLCGERVPMGDVRYRLGDVGVAIEICEEAWDAAPASIAHADAVDIVLNPSASHFALGKYARRETLVTNTSRALQVVYVYANLVGNEAGRIIYDGGVLVAQAGDVIGRGPRFGYGDGTLTAVDIDPAAARRAKLRTKPVRDSMPGDVELGEIEGDDPRAIAAGAKRSGATAVPRPKTLAAAAAAAPYVPMTRNEEFLAAETLGLFDYMRKTRAKGYVVSLSGGVDSATTAVLVGHMLAEAVQAFGMQGAMARLGLAGAAPSDVRALVGRCLTCVYQRTVNSGKATESAAAGVAAAIGADYHAIDVQPAVDLYVGAAAAALGRPLTWEQDDIALQNVQARARAPFAWLVANVRQAILLTTSNRSEAAVGYATMDGDTAGGLAPLGGIDKRFLREWLRWAETACRTGLGPLPALGAVNSMPPTAELRPGHHGQTDETDLMPYVVLERIERLIVRDRQAPDDALQLLAVDFPEIAAADLKAYLAKFLKLWSQSQWKRERLAPAFHLDDMSVDPKTWCRFPIVSAPSSLS
jgi:NAD+ synthase (glutamine-hydrolysing)